MLSKADFHHYSISAVYSKKKPEFLPENTGRNFNIVIPQKHEKPLKFKGFSCYDVPAGIHSRDLSRTHMIKSRLLPGWAKDAYNPNGLDS